MIWARFLSRHSRSPRPLAAATVFLAFDIVWRELINNPAKAAIGWSNVPNTIEEIRAALLSARMRSPTGASRRPLGARRLTLGRPPAALIGTQARACSRQSASLRRYVEIADGVDRHRPVEAHSRAASSPPLCSLSFAPMLHGHEYFYPVSLLGRVPNSPRAGPPRRPASGRDRQVRPPPAPPHRLGIVAESAAEDCASPDQPSQWRAVLKSLGVPIRFITQCDCSWDRSRKNQTKRQVGCDVEHPASVGGWILFERP